MFKIVPKKGVEQFYITRGQISAYITGNLSKTEPLNMHLKVTALIPLKGETNAVEYDIVSGTNPGYLLGTTFDPDWDVVDAFDSVTAGAVTVTIDGGTPQAITGLNFSTITTTAGIIDILNAATTGAIWSFDENEYRFKLTSNSLGAASTVAVTNGGSGTNLNVTTLLGTNGQTPVAGS
jgi:hypothetical protein